ncbi:cobalamin biosynthesis protein [Devosia yakushimensis]|uniref:Cobalamin biosynthesis protein n=1 Tax=Devosia yakushimensis TaxID=470028 RepID=A0ABQ5UHD2_9HYPH|nr:glycerophosphodiester phosphodiesterase family protein [Devosia yakushimensis]GLQ10608.1 cobalamin biosynthesis protein [Devosia yakushimensis]
MKIIAHRGDSASFPENTPEGWSAAYTNGAFAIEADVRLSRDGFCICAHDPDLKRLFGRPERPEDLMLNELLDLRNEAGNRIVMLAKVLQHAEANQHVLLDIKDETPPALEAIWEAIVETVPASQRPLVIAGCHTLDAVHFFAAKGQVGILGFIPAPDEAEAFFGAGSGIIRLWERDVTSDRVAMLHALGAEVWVTAGGRGTTYGGGDTSRQNLEAFVKSGVNGVLVNDVAMTRIALENLL